MSIELRAFGIALLAGLFAVGILFTLGIYNAPPSQYAVSPSITVAKLQTVDGTAAESPQVIEGSNYFQQSCARCHGADAEGNNGAPSLHAEDMSDADMEQIINNGSAPMPAFYKTYNAQQVKSLIAFIHTLK